MINDAKQVINEVKHHFHNLEILMKYYLKYEKVLLQIIQANKQANLIKAT